MSSPLEEPQVTANPFFSIIILCWKSNQYLPSCLDALISQTEKDFEILVLDNGSPETIPQTIFSGYKTLNIQWLKVEENLGFAAGNNFVASLARGTYLVLLNADAFPESDWLQQVRRGIEKYPRSCYASRLIMAEHPDRYDGKGDVYHASGLAWRDSYNASVDSAPDVDHEAFSACAAAAIYPRDAFLQVGGFDTDFFAYIEDVDLGFRLRLAGYRCIYLSAATVRHVGSASTGLRSEFAIYYGQRNTVWAFFKDMPGIWVWLLAPAHILVNLLQILMAYVRKRGRVSLKAKIDALKGLPAVLKRRKSVQRSRVASIGSVLRAMDWNPFSPLIKWIQR